MYPVEGERSIDVAAPPDRVWALVADVARMGQWSPHTAARARAVPGLHALARATAAAQPSDRRTPDPDRAGKRHAHDAGTITLLNWRSSPRHARGEERQFRRSEPAVTYDGGAPLSLRRSGR